MFKKILVPLDGSKRSEAVLGPVLKMAENSTGSAILFHAVLPSELFSLTAAQYVRRERQRATEYLHELSQRLGGHGATVVEKVVTGDPAGSILTEAQQADVDLIAMTTHGRGGVQGWPIGSVTERILKKATRPVLVLRGDPASAAGIRRILIALDGSEAAMAAIPPASELAAALGASVVLVHVGTHVPLTVQRAVRAVNRQRIPVTTRLLHGDPTRSLLAAAQEEASDLLAITAPRSPQGERSLLGRVGEALMSETQQPLLVVRAPLVA